MPETTMQELRWDGVEYQMLMAPELDTVVFAAGDRRDLQQVVLDEGFTVISRMLKDYGPCTAVVAMLNQDSLEVLDVVAGVVTDLHDATGDSDIYFDDGFTVPYYDILAFKLWKGVRR